MNTPTANISRRDALRSVMSAAALATVATWAPSAVRAAQTSTVGAPSGPLAELTARLAAAPRRRSFHSVPLIVHEPGDWDHEAAAALLEYRYRPSQVWDNADLSGAWPGLMRESLNGQVFAHHHPDFLQVGAMHGAAHLAMFDQSAWDRYELTALTGGKFSANTLILERPGVSVSDDLEKSDGFYSPMNNNVTSLRKRGAVFVACHDSIHAIASSVVARRSGEPVARVAADLTNHLIPGAVLVPSVVAFIAELAQSGYSYVKT